MASSQVPVEGVDATFAKNVEEGHESAAARPDRLRFMHKDVADFLLSASRRRGTKATPPPVHEEGERARYDCKFEEDEDAEGFAPPRLVWGKVRSHQWWPGQVFDPANASELAQQQRRKRGSVLVAFFWDKTFGWADAAALCPLRAGFPWLVPGSRGPCASAVAAALGEVARRVDAGLSCSCDGAAAKKQVIENAGVRDGACGAAPDSAFARGSFRGEAFVGYISSLAVAPLAGADGLELTIATAQLRAFTRWRGPRGLPEYTACYGVDGVEAAAPARRARKRRRSRGGDDADASAGAWSMSRCGGTEDEACESADDAMGLEGSDGRSRTKIGKLMSRAAQQMSKSPVSGAMARCTSVTDDTDAALKNGDLKDDEPLPAGLFLNFTNPSAVPSASDLVSMFSQFGPIEEARTTGNSVAAVIFKRRADAETAFASPGKLSALSTSLISFRLAYSMPGAPIDDPKSTLDTAEKDHPPVEAVQ